MFRLKEEAARCLLCLEGACTAACEKGFDPARAVRAIRFENEAGQETLLIREYVTNVQEIAKTFVFIMTDL